jgi:hypothetical protein
MLRQQLDLPPFVGWKASAALRAAFRLGGRLIVLSFGVALRAHAINRCRKLGGR